MTDKNGQVRVQVCKNPLKSISELREIKNLSHIFQKTVDYKVNFCFNKNLDRLNRKEY